MAHDSSQIKIIRAVSDLSMLVVAPPGYGKTYVMARRIEQLIRSDALLPPKRLLGLTFTNAAASEMKNRVLQTIPQRKLNNIDLTTIHSFCYQVLNAYGTYISVNRDFGILSEIESESLINQIANGMSIDFSTDNGKLQKRFQKWRTEQILKQDSTYNDAQYDDIFSQILERYRTKCSDHNYLDFDHILIATHRLFDEHPTILEIYRATYDYVLVDEFQDTNPLQFNILAQLIEGHTTSEQEKYIPVCLFGDKDQAIYEFMGATPENVEKGISRFNCEQMRLEKNHRTSSAKILELSSALRSDIPNLSSTMPIELTIEEDLDSEAKQIIKEIKQLNIPLHHICVIAPNKYRLANLNSHLKNDNTIPFVFIPDFSAKGLEEEFSQIFSRLRTVTEEHSSLRREIQQVVKTMEINDYQEDVLAILLDMARDYDLRLRNESLTTRANEFLNHILLQVNWADLVRKTVKDKLYISTMHGVKGLQFEHVFICGLENYLMPHSSICVDLCSHGNKQAQISSYLNESQKLLYVSVTRSIEDISFYAVRSVSRNGQQKQRKLTCLLTPLKEYLTINTVGNVIYCGL